MFCESVSIESFSRIYRMLDECAKKEAERKRQEEQRQIEEFRQRYNEDV